MKTTIFCALLALTLVRCGNALDGDVKTDTTNLMVDTGARSAVNDTATHVNTNTGEYPNDTMTQHNYKGDVRSSSPSSPDSRNSTPGSGQQK